MTKKDNAQQERDETKARIVAFSDYKYLFLGITAVCGIIYFILRLFGYDVSAPF